MSQRYSMNAFSYFDVMPQSTLKQPFRPFNNILQSM